MITTALALCSGSTIWQAAYVGSVAARVQVSRLGIGQSPKRNSLRLWNCTNESHSPSRRVGSRLRPITATIPKCLVPIHGQPLLDIWLEQLTAHGIGPFLVNTHYLPEQVEYFVEQSPYRDSVTLAHETQLLGTAGTVWANREWIGDEPFMLVHADNYCLCDFRAFVECHRLKPPDALMTMMTFQTDTPESCGILRNE